MYLSCSLILIWSCHFLQVIWEFVFSCIALVLKRMLCWVRCGQLLGYLDHIALGLPSVCQTWLIKGKPRNYREKVYVYGPLLYFCSTIFSSSLIGHLWPNFNNLCFHVCLSHIFRLSHSWTLHVKQNSLIVKTTVWGKAAFLLCEQCQNTQL